ncbi:lipopolysaccharide kinase InaA family protein [Halanaerobium hydrogeniformans]|uniref:Protein kinase domain-containing protein n=1 Tax=Halanaerobium hydrogeniformans TaxID=656519 RepID=E4RJW8_HALHG|nr:lipopolysaccharide kinase InaA family protein [Halanaerobium hydrogeniformans]ADQ15538.1 hypothetical protein Halsa_2122 [Halanaerobium hydrogeniformans]
MKSKNKSFISYQKNNIDILVKANTPPEWIKYFIDKFGKEKEIKIGETIYYLRNQLVKVYDPILEMDIVIKSFKLDKLYDKLRFRFIPSKAERSLKIARELEKIKLKTPAPIAVIEKRGKTNELIFSYYITEYLDYDFNMLEIAKDFNHPERDKIENLMPQLGKEVRKMHEAGIVHNDLHAGNILVKNYETKPELYYIDLNRGRIKEKLTKKDKINDLKRLKFTEQEKDIFFKSYSLNKWEYYKKEVSAARKKRRQFVRMKKKLRSFFGIKRN